MTLEELGFPIELQDRLLVYVPSVHGGSRCDDGIVQGFSKNKRAVRLTHMQTDSQWVPLENIIDVLPKTESDVYDL